MKVKRVKSKYRNSEQKREKECTRILTTADIDNSSVKIVADIVTVTGKRSV